MGLGIVLVLLSFAGAPPPIDWHPDLATAEAAAAASGKAMLVVFR